MDRLRSRYHYWLGLAHRSRGNNAQSAEAYHDAIEQFTLSIDIDPDFAAAFYARGTVYWRELSDYQRAVRDFTDALERDPSIAMAYLNRGLSRVFGRIGTREEALNDFERYLELGKDGYWRVEAHNQIARLKGDQGKDTQAAL